MMQSIKELVGFHIKAVDGRLGKVDGFYFDDEAWIIRYLLVDTGKWLPGRTVLISPRSLEKPDREHEEFPLNLTKKQIEESPEMDQEKPVSRQHEIELAEYYGWPSYWIGPGAGYVPGTGLIPPPALARPEKELRELQRQKEKGDPHLRSSREVIGYHIHAEDDRIGHVEDFIIDDETWIMRYLIIDTHNWLPGGKKVIVAVPWIKRIDWSNSEVHIDLKKESLEKAPEFEGTASVTRNYEDYIYNHYEKEKYWDG